MDSSSLTVEKIIDHVRNRPYMGGIVRTADRVKITEEVFTPTALVQETLDHLPAVAFSDPEKTFIDNSCGDGQYLSEVLIRKVQNGIPFDIALSTLYGVDLMQDNVELCRERLLCGQEHLRHIVEQNIVCHSALTYHYRFGKPEVFGNGLFEMPT
jgi:hypothetical protein